VPDRDKIIASVIALVEGIQSASGRSHEGISGQTSLFGDIDGFDSLNGLEMLVMVGASLETDLPEQMLRPMSNGASVTVGDLVERILKQMEGHDGDN